MSATMMSGSQPNRLLDHLQTVMSDTHNVEFGCKKRFHSLQHQRMVVGQQNTTTIP